MKDFDASRWFEKVLWGLIVFIGASGVNSLREMTSSINDLNMKMAAIMQKMIVYDKELDEHGLRLNSLEDRSRRR